jgi:hypothetical protein
MSWEKVLSILVAGVLLAVPLYAKADRDKDERHGQSGHHGNFDDDDDDGDGKGNRAERDARFEAQLITHYTVFAGSQANATSLVRGLHNHATVVLTRVVTTTTTTPGTTCPPPVSRFDPPCTPGQPQTVTVTQTQTESFDPPTRPMKYKQVAIALAFLELLFKEQSISTPTPAQIKAGLVGDTGILTMRAKKMSWEHIARALGFKLADAKPRGRDD